MNRMWIHFLGVSRTLLRLTSVQRLVRLTAIAQAGRAAMLDWSAFSNLRKLWRLLPSTILLWFAVNTVTITGISILVVAVKAGLVKFGLVDPQVILGSWKAMYIYVSSIAGSLITLLTGWCMVIFYNHFTDILDIIQAQQTLPDQISALYSFVYVAGFKMWGEFLYTLISAPFSLSETKVVKEYLLLMSNVTVSLVEVLDYIMELCPDWVLSAYDAGTD